MLLCVVVVVAVVEDMISGRCEYGIAEERKKSRTRKRMDGKEELSKDEIAKWKWSPINTLMRTDGCALSVLMSPSGVPLISVELGGTMPGVPNTLFPTR